MKKIVLVGRINYLLGGRRDLIQRLRAVEKERYDDRERVELLVRNINEDGGVLRETRERECNSRPKAIGGISEEITDMGKYMERDQDKAGADGDAFTSSKANVCLI